MNESHVLGLVREQVIKTIWESVLAWPAEESETLNKIQQVSTIADNNFVLFSSLNLKRNKRIVHTLYK